jgi:hypothetical protein
MSGVVFARGWSMFLKDSCGFSMNPWQALLVLLVDFDWK